MLLNRHAAFDVKSGPDLHAESGWPLPAPSGCPNNDRPLGTQFRRPLDAVYWGQGLHMLKRAAALDAESGRPLSCESGRALDAQSEEPKNDRWLPNISSSNHMINTKDTRPHLQYSENVSQTK